MSGTARMVVVEKRVSLRRKVCSPTHRESSGTDSGGKPAVHPSTDSTRPGLISKRPLHQPIRTWRLSKASIITELRRLGIPASPSAPAPATPRLISADSSCAI